MSLPTSLQEAPLTEIKNFTAPKGGKAFFFTTSDQVRIRVAIWNSESTVGTIILQSGRTEFIEKYFEVIQEFIDRGFCIAMFDWRGQGLSDRLIDNPYLGHIEDFSLYDKEFEEILDSVYLPSCPRPWVGMGHSMGGCLIASKAEAGPKIFNLIILCAPMLSLKLPKPVEVLGLMVGVMSKLGFRSSAFPQPEWRKRKGWHEIPFEENVVTSDEFRFKRGGDLVRANENLALGGITVAWAHESIKRVRRFNKSDWGKDIDCPTLLLSATQDKLVDPKRNELICKAIPHITIAQIEGNHELLMERDSIRSITWNHIDKFLDKYL